MATTTTKTELLVGKRIRRREDPRLITGTATYVDDIQMPGMHYACIVRSPHAAARIRSIDIKAALEFPASRRSSPARIRRRWGRCRAALRCPDCACRIITFWRRNACISSAIRWPWWSRPIATSRAMPPNRSKSIMSRCAAVADPEKALAPGAPAVHPEWPDNKAFNYHQEGGEIDKAFAEAEVVVKQRITSQRLIPTAMETRGVVARMARRPTAQLNLYTSTQIPHLMRTLVALMLGLEENRLRVVTPEVGGGFGSKLNVYAEEALMGFVAMKIGKPVKWIESRRENFTMHHPRPRPRGLLRNRGQARRHHSRHQAEDHSGSGRVSSVADAGHPHAERADDAGPV